MGKKLRKSGSLKQARLLIIIRLLLVAEQKPQKIPIHSLNRIAANKQRKIVTFTRICARRVLVLEFSSDATE